jgi:glyoxylase-like metal-dependent hydrolase (beta-lactamase superfamily II)
MQPVVRISEDIYQVHVPIPFPLISVNCYLVRDPDGWTMIDTGLKHSPALEAWDAAFTGLGIEAGDLHRILLTHAHPDHYGLAGHFQQISSAPVFALEKEIRVVPIEWQNDGGHMYALASFLKNHGAPRDVVERVKVRSLEVLHMVQPQPVLSPLQEGDEVGLAGESYRVIWVPGHADGHLVLLRQGGDLAFVGDHVLSKITPNIALWPGLDPNPLRSYLTSVDTLEELKHTVALPGHRALIHDLPARAAELREHHRLRALECWEAAGEAATAYEVCLRVFPRLKNIDDVRMAMVETLSHLEYLVSEGRLERSEGSIIRYRQRFIL